VLNPRLEAHVTRLLRAEAGKVVVDVIGHLFFGFPGSRLSQSITLVKGFLPAAIFNRPKILREL
jgi:hypothetical protein